MHLQSCACHVLIIDIITKIRVFTDWFYFNIISVSSK